MIFQKKTFAFLKTAEYNKNRKKENVYFSKILFHFLSVSRSVYGNARRFL